MSDANPAAGQPANAAEAEFQRYKARMGGAAMMMPMMMPQAMPGWAMPPSLAPFPVAPFGMPGVAGAGQASSIGDRLGTTVRLGIELLNAVLASSAGALGNAAVMLPQGGAYGRGECGCGGGCGCSGDCGCGTDCCEVMGCGCCQPGLFGCCR